jgi:hypothetical protein
MYVTATSTLTRHLQIPDPYAKTFFTEATPSDRYTYQAKAIINFD